MAKPVNADGDRFDTIAAIIVEECGPPSGLASYEIANFQEAIANALRREVAASSPGRGTHLVELEATLAPFAVFAEWGDEPQTEFTENWQQVTSAGMLADTPDDFVLLNLSPGCPPITMGDFRRARKVWSGEATARLQPAEGGE